jgi:hypothetical protein
VRPRFQEELIRTGSSPERPPIKKHGGIRGTDGEVHAPDAQNRLLLPRLHSLQNCRTKALILFKTLRQVLRGVTVLMLRELTEPELSKDS